jgi:hypothetical protein
VLLGEGIANIVGDDDWHTSVLHVSVHVKTEQQQTVASSSHTLKRNFTPPVTSTFLCPTWGATRKLSYYLEEDEDQTDIMSEASSWTERMTDPTMIPMQSNWGFLR